MEQQQKNDEMYHEKQKLMRCALHTLNNLFQEQAFTKEDLDEIAYNLTPGSMFNPHKSILGVGNYDVNVIINAVRLKGYSIQWWDRRKDLSLVPYDTIFGIIVNYVSIRWFAVWESRHWFPMRPILVGGKPLWFSFDSKLTTPLQFENIQQVIAYLHELILNKRGEVLLVIKEQPQETQPPSTEQPTPLPPTTLS